LSCHSTKNDTNKVSAAERNPSGRFQRRARRERTNSQIEPDLLRKSGLDRRKIHGVPLADGASSERVFPSGAVVHGSDGREGDGVLGDDSEGGRVEAVEAVVAESGSKGGRMKAIARGKEFALERGVERKRGKERKREQEMSLLEVLGRLDAKKIQISQSRVVKREKREASSKHTPYPALQP
jgi:hypothetical protein